MNIRTNVQSATHHTQQIANRGNMAASIPAVTSSNSSAATQANSSGVRVTGFISRYQVIVARSSNSISVLSNNIITFDVQASTQFGR